MQVDDLRRAARIYLKFAYPDGAIPPAVLRRLEWPTDGDPTELLTHPPFERANKPGAPPIHSLRLGNSRYPHMKLQVQPWPTSVGFMLSVNTHDQVLGLDPAAPDAEAFRALQTANQRIKDAIEQAWAEAGLPTFLRYLRDYLDAQASSGDPNGPQSPGADAC